MATVLSRTWTLFTVGEPERLWLMTTLPSAFHATVLPVTSVLPELLTTMPPPQPQAVNPKPFSQTLLLLMVPLELISYRIPWWVLSWTLLPVMETLVQ